MIRIFFQFLNVVDFWKVYFNFRRTSIHFNSNWFRFGFCCWCQWYFSYILLITNFTCLSTFEAVLLWFLLPFKSLTSSLLEPWYIIWLLLLMLLLSWRQQQERIYTGSLLVNQVLTVPKGYYLLLGRIKLYLQ